MDQRLFHAAQTGNIGFLDQLIAEDPLILEKVSLGTNSETPLHIAALVGQINFVKEILRRKPEFAMELNKDGFSPIHMASANGHLEIVKELLRSQVGLSLCFLKDREGRTPLHCAVIKGRIGVIGELLCACPDSVREITARCETVLHLAVKNNQFELLQLLVERHIDGELLNAKDWEGNTVLHLAISRRQYWTVKFLVSSQTVSKVEVNAKNMSNLTALDIFDVLIQNSNEPGDIEIGEMLLRAGAMRSREVTDNVQPPLCTHVSTDFLVISEPAPTHSRSLWKEFTKEMYRELEDSESETRSSLMVVAVLIATLTFQAGINPPGGVWQENSQGNFKNTTHRSTPNAIMASQFVCYIGFMIYNTAGFLMSIVIILLLTNRFPLKSWLRIAVVSMLATYVCCVCFLTLTHRAREVCLLLIVLFIGTIIGWQIWWLKKWAMIVQTRRSNDSNNRDSSMSGRMSRFILSFNSRTNAV